MERERYFKPKADPMKAKATHTVYWTDTAGYSYSITGGYLDCQALFEALKISPAVREVSVTHKPE